MAKTVRVVVGNDPALKTVNLISSGDNTFATDVAGPGAGNTYPTVQPGGDGSNNFKSLIIPGYGAFQNFQPACFKNWRAAVARVRAQSGRARLMVLGASDEIGTGSGSGGTHNMTNALPTGWVPKLANALAAQVPTSFNSTMGDQSIVTAGGTTPAYDTRISYGANWGTGNNGALGGDQFKYTTGAVNNFSFTPTQVFDTIDFWYFTATGNGSATVNVDGGSSLGTINFGATNFQMHHTVFTVARGTHTINVVPSNNGSFNISGFIVYDSTVPAVDFLQCGSYGAFAANVASIGNVYGPSKMVANLAPDLTIIACTTNDSNAQTALASYITSMQTAITYAQMSGDVLLMVEPVSNTVQSTNGTLATYIAAMKSLALANNAAMFDITQFPPWQTWASANAVYPMYDNNHPGAAGYANIASILATGLGLTL